MRAELKALLAQPLLARGVSTRYVTSGSRPIVDDFIAGRGMYQFGSYLCMSFKFLCSSYDDAWYEEHASWGRCGGPKTKESEKTGSGNGDGGMGWNFLGVY